MSNHAKPESTESTPAPPPTPGAEPEVHFGETMKRLGAVGPLAIIAASLPAIGGFALLGFMPQVADWLKSHAESGSWIYSVGFAITSGLALLPTYAQALLGGFTFGRVNGTLLALAGITGGALIGYVIARVASGDRATKVIAEHRKWQAVYEALLGGGFWKTLGLVTLLRLPPNSPFAITNLVLAATKVPPLIYTIGTIVGIAPRTAVVVWIGAGMTTFDASAGKSWILLVVNIVAALVIVGVIGHLANRAIARVTGMNNGGGDVTPGIGDNAPE